MEPTVTISLKEYNQMKIDLDIKNTRIEALSKDFAEQISNLINPTKNHRKKYQNFEAMDESCNIVETYVFLKKEQPQHDYYLLKAIR